MMQRLEASVDGGVGLQGLERLLDVVFLPPSAVLFAPNTAESVEPCLFFLDRGSLTMQLLAANGAEAHRLAKLKGPGAVLSSPGFSCLSASSAAMPTSAVADTYCTLLRLPRSRCVQVEASDPQLALAVYKLAASRMEERLHDYVLHHVAAESFRVPIRPSNSLSRMLLSSSVALAPAAAGEPAAAVSASSSTDTLVSDHQRAPSPELRGCSPLPERPSPHAARRLVSLEDFQQRLSDNRPMLMAGLPLSKARSAPNAADLERQLMRDYTTDAERSAVMLPRARELLSIQRSRPKLPASTSMDGGIGLEMLRQQAHGSRGSES